MILVQEGSDLPNGAVVTITGNGVTIALESSTTSGTLTLGAVATDTTLSGSGNKVSATFNAAV